MMPYVAPAHPHTHAPMTPVTSRPQHIGDDDLQQVLDDLQTYRAAQ